MRTKIEILKNALLFNVKNLSLFSQNIFVVVKANAYGHGIKEVTSILNNSIARGFAIANNEEVFEIFDYKSLKKEIIVMSPIVDDCFEQIVFETKNICFFVYSIDFLKELDFWTRLKKKKIKINLKIETGLNRLGIKINDFKIACEIILNNKFFIFTGMSTHYNDVYRYEEINILKQKEKFDFFLKILLNKNFSESNLYLNGMPSGTIDFIKNEPIRAGSFVYGFWKSEEQKKRFLEKNPNFEIKECFKWKAKILQIKEVEAGETIGYGIETVLCSKKKIALIPIGYSDGYSILFFETKNGIFLISGKIVKVIGLISMNIIAVDITEFPEISINDEVTIVDSAFEGFSVRELASKVKISTLQFSSLISSKIQRVIV